MPLKTTRILPVALVILLVFALVPASFADESAGTDGSGSAGAGHGRGYVQPEIDNPNIDDYDYGAEAGASARKRARVAAASLPSSYDYRVENPDLLTEVRNQGSYGTCWAHAALTSASGSLARNGTESAAVPLSPLHLALSGYSGDYEAAGFISDNLLNSGGNEFIAAAAMSRWHSPVLEDGDYGYGNAGQYQNRVRVFKKADADRSDYHLEAMMELPAPRDSKGDFDEGNLRAIKSTLIEKGPLQICYKDVTGYYGSASGVTTFYNEANGTGEINHAVTLVGYDDDFSADNFSGNGGTPPGDGAFICQNSWGSGWGTDGFFYISYYEPSVAGIAYFDLTDKSGYDEVQYYDELGWGGAWSYSASSAFGANVFEIPADGAARLLKGTGIILYDPGMTYEITAYLKPAAGKPNSGQQLDLNGSAAGAAVTGSAVFAGYYSVPFEDGVLLKPGESYSVVVKFTNTAGDMAGLPFEYMYADGSLTMNSGESYISSGGGTWTDLYAEYQKDDRCGNLNIKAFSDVIGAQSGIVLDVAGLRTEYMQGESLDLSGGSVLAEYEEGYIDSSRAVALTAAGVDVSGYDPEKTGRQTVHVAKDGFSASFEVNVAPRAVTPPAEATPPAVSPPGSTAPAVTPPAENPADDPSAVAAPAQAKKIKLARPKALSVKARKKALRVTWKKAAASQKITGYQLAYRKAGAKKWTVRSYSRTRTTVTLKKLKSGKKYRIKLRTYRIVRSGAAKGKYYSKWSSVRTARVR